jgi:hypothetical protein
MPGRRPPSVCGRIRPVGKAVTRKYKPPEFPLVGVVPDRCGVVGAAQGAGRGADLVRSAELVFGIGTDPGG